MAPGDGYAMRIVPTEPIELAFAFGGFLCCRDKDAYQGSEEYPGGIVAAISHDQQFSSPDGKTSIATLANIVGSKHELLGETLDSVLLTDRATRSFASRGTQRHCLERIAASTRRRRTR